MEIKIYIDKKYQKEYSYNYDNNDTTLLNNLYDQYMDKGEYYVSLINFFIDKIDDVDERNNFMIYLFNQQFIKSYKLNPHTSIIDWRFDYYNIHLGLSTLERLKKLNKIKHLINK